ncbi:MAG: N-acetylmuramoyl-L-alanine amidase family protein, partial [Schaalia georgiae]|nr:N-acetylmuramoyl-L-alanine amidase family protein [Schaalia georgiae]
WYFMQPSGAMATGWLQLGGTWYYLQPNGVMAYGIVEINGVPHAFEINGAWVGAWNGSESEDVAP